MLNIFLIPLLLIPPILFASSALIDKKLTVGEEDDSTPEALMVIGAFFNALVSIPILIYLIYKGSLYVSAPLFLNGILVVLAIWLYLHAMNIEDSDRVVVWYQLIPAIGLIGGYLMLGEVLQLSSVFYIFLIIVGSIITSMRKGKFNKKMVILMVLSAALFAFNDLFFAMFGREIDVSNALLSDLLGKAFWSIPFLFYPTAISGFILGLKTKLHWQTFNEIIYIIGDLFVDLAKLFAPVAIAQAFASTVPVFVFIGATFLGIFYPSFLREEYQKEYLVQKIIGILVTVIGGVLLALNIY